VNVIVFSLNKKELTTSLSIHPRTKMDVGYRLSRSGLAVAYNQNVEFQGPIVSNVSYLYGDQTINVTFTAVTSMELRNPNGFQVYFLIYSINKIPCE
jgi:hypothetical protein